MLAPTDMQDSFLSYNEFELCLQSFLRPSLALSPYEFATFIRVPIPSPVPACLRSLPGPSLALSPIELLVIDIDKKRREQEPAPLLTINGESRFKR